ncbi:hypothetical protein EIP86_006962 [Pleurotus ostreatoroseus]|nr:hypothetical protein EIP86_006962 [Pleurotus ostreatoroseus]
MPPFNIHILPLLTLPSSPPHAAILCNWCHLTGGRNIHSANYGGGRPRRELPLSDVATNLVLAGALDGLFDGDHLTLLRLMDVDEPMRCTKTQVIAALPPACACDLLIKVARRHSIILPRSRTSRVVNEVVSHHICSDECPRDVWLLSLPSRTTVKGIQFVQEITPVPNSNFNLNVRFKVPVVLNPIVSNFPADVITPTAAAAHPPGDPSVHIPVRDPRPRLATTDDPVPFPPRVLTVDKLAGVVRSWCQDVTAHGLAETPCGVCAQAVRSSTMEYLPLSGDWLNILRDTSRTVISQVYDGPDDYPLLCLQSIDRVRDHVAVCKLCYRALRTRKAMPRTALANGLWLGPVPDELKNMTLMEKQLVARYRLKLCVITVAGSGGARKMNANAAVFSQPVSKFYNVLPPRREELEEVIAVMLTGPCAPTEDDFKLTPLLVRHWVVLRALEWLRVHHRDYHDVVISTDNLSTYSEHEPAVAWYDQKANGDPESAALAVNETPDDRGVDSGPCSFSVHGVTSDETIDMSYKLRKAVVAQHITSGGCVVGYGKSAQLESLFHNPKLLPGLFPWLFPYGFGRSVEQWIIY